MMANIALSVNRHRVALVARTNPTGGDKRVVVAYGIVGFA